LDWRSGREGKGADEKAADFQKTRGGVGKVLLEGRTKRERREREGEEGNKKGQ
jgi:hypothetical protein